ncbi:alpha/beta hydrolase [Alkalimonas sp. MEB108]|uniref:Alpha/beta hydrolase n=1 Tax=Alkalimonas cellulosilytica TaxID=3058395 RepID=A0ABU7J8W1_9GAMM|nr:alpha/beta hydrolase [Alkalimonas sp. MEB108]MEE2002946.1 alpha/beta hydrolase [Alkalimonas sp. MEB108]
MWRWLFRLLLLCLLIAGYVSYQLVRYPDISPERLLSHYTDGQVQQRLISGQPLYYQDQGKGQAIVLLHSHFFSMQMWDPIADELARYYRVIRFDLTSHGLTGPALDNDYSLDRDIELLRGLIEALAPGPVVLVGSSLGGNIAIGYSARYPEQVKALVLQNSGGFRKADSRGGRGEDLPAWADYLLYMLPRAAYNRFLQWMIVDDSLITPQLQWQFHDNFRRQGNRKAEMQRIRQFKEGGAATQLQQLTLPVLIQWGEANPQLPVAMTELFVEALVQAASVQVITYPNTGHVLPLERPAESLADLRHFLQQLPGSRLEPAEQEPANDTL